MKPTPPEIVVERLEFYRDNRQRMLNQDIAEHFGLKPSTWVNWRRAYVPDDDDETLSAAIENAAAERDDLDRLARIAAEIKAEHARTEHAREAFNEQTGNNFGWVRFKNLLERAAARGLDGSLPGGPLPPGQILRGASALWSYPPRDPDADPDAPPPPPVKRLEWVKSREDDERSAESFALYVRSALSHLKGAAPAVAAPAHVNEDLAVIYPRPDLHIGLLAWGQESGADWDLTIARRVLGEAAAALVAGAPPAHTGVVLGLGDFFHADDGTNRTRESQNALDVDGRYAKVIEAGVWLEIAKVQMALERHERVIYTAVPGNHDPHAYRALLIGVRMFFHGNERVTVDSNPAPYWYWRHGRCLIGATHGHRVKAPDLPMLMANHRPQDWGECPVRRYYVGHRHHKAMVEIGGVVVEQFGSPSAKDAYHAAGPWISGRGLVAITLHRERGEIGRQEYAITGDA